MSRLARFALTGAALVGGLAFVPLALIVAAQSGSPSSSPAVVAAIPGTHAPTAPTDLRVESVEHPLGLDTASPRFSWKVTDVDRGDAQSAYRVRVATSAANLAAGALVWDSGRVVSTDMTQVAYSGPALTSRSRYVWDAETWDSTGRSSTASQSWFEMGLLAPADWTANYITSPFGYARTTFDTTAGRTVASARVYVAAYLPLTTVKDHTDGTVNTFGAYYLWANGAKVTPDLFEPNWTVSTKQVLYRTYDATSFVVNGRNVIGLAMSRPNVMVQLEITYDNGSRSTVTSGSNWRTSAGPVTSSNFLTQELYDARLEQTGWQSPTFDDSRWAAATTAPSAGPLVSAAAYPPIRVSSVVTPTTIESLGNGRYMVDLGQNYAAMPRISVNGDAGRMLTVTYGEDWNATTKTMTRTMGQSDRFTLRAGAQTFELQYSYRGFRYMIIDGWPDVVAPTTATITALAVNTVLPDAITFSSSSDLYNRIHEMAKRTLTNNAHGHPEDCPHREKGGWGADANAASAAMLYDFDASGFYTKWLTDIRLAQAADGSVRSVNGMYTGQATWDDPAWGTVYPMLTWNTYRTYGDRRLLQANFDGIKRFVDDLANHATANIVDHPDYSWGQDWAAMQITDAKLFDTAYLYIDTNIVADIATIVGQPDVAATYRARAAAIKVSFNTTFYSSTAHEYSSGGVHSQASNAIPLAVGLVPDDQRAAVVATLRAQVAAGKGDEAPWQPAAAPGILTGGVIGSQYIGRALASNGLSDVVGAFFQSKAVGSFGNMLDNGPGTVWEYAAPWDDILSKDHPALAGQTSWLYENLAGIQQSPTSVAFESLVIDPQHQSGITFVNTTKKTPHGDVVSNWNTTTPGSAFVHEVGIPFDSSAVVRVSTAGLTNGQITEGNTVIYRNGVFTPVDGVTRAVAGSGYVDFTVGSGRYVFKTTEAPVVSSVRTVLDGDDGRFTYSGFTRYAAQVGSVNSTLQSGWIGSSAAFVCERCLSMQWIAPVGPDRGRARVRVDGGAWSNVDLYSPVRAYQQTVWASSTLTLGSHTMEIQSTGRNPASEAPVVEIDAVVVYSDAPVVPRSATVRTVIDSDDAQWVYTGFHRYTGLPAWVNQTIESGVTGSVASYRCASCTTLELILAKGPDRGIAQVRVDGGQWTSVDLYAATSAYQQNAWTSGTLPAGAHTVEIKGVGKNALSGAPVIEIDAIAVTS